MRWAGRQYLAGQVPALAAHARVHPSLLSRACAPLRGHQLSSGYCGMQRIHRLSFVPEPDLSRQGTPAEVSSRMRLPAFWSPTAMRTTMTAFSGAAALTHRVVFLPFEAYRGLQKS